MSGIAGALAGIHLGIALMTKHEHWAIEEAEADAMAKSVANVARHYPKVAGSQKLIDWAMLASTVGMMYVPRIMVSRDLIEQKRKGQTHAGDMAVAA